MTDDFLKLMIPGPIQPDPAVLEAMGLPVKPHYGPAFTEYYAATIELLRKVFETRSDVFLMVGSGTCAIDACMGSALSSGDTIVIGTNGFFGGRLVHIARAYNLNVIEVKAEWGQALDPHAIEQALDAHPQAKAVAVVHLETSTTIINPVEEIAGVAHRHGALILVDAVSSLGGVPLKVDEWEIDLCASATQKCLGSPPGLAPVSISERAWQVIDQVPEKGHGFYGNLRIWKQYAVDWADWHPFPITMATNNIVALRTSLDQLLAEGIPNRLERYRCLALRLRAGLRSIGYEPYTPDAILAPVLTAAYAPQRVSTGPIVSYMETKHRIKISGGLGDLKNTIIRIGHMSPVVSEADIDEVVARLSEYPN